MLNYRLMNLFLLKHLITDKFAFIYKNNRLKCNKVGTLIKMAEVL